MTTRDYHIPAEWPDKTGPCPICALEPFAEECINCHEIIGDSSHMLCTACGKIECSWCATRYSDVRICWRCTVEWNTVKRSNFKSQTTPELRKELYELQYKETTAISLGKIRVIEQLLEEREQVLGILAQSIIDMYSKL